MTVLAWVASHLLPTALAERAAVADELEDDVIARRAVEDVVAGAADQHVVAGAAQEGVVAGTAEQHVVVAAAVRGEQRRVGRQAGGVDHVVARQRVDRDPVAAGDRAGHVDAGGETEHRGARANARDDHDVVAVRGVGDDVVGCAVVAATVGVEVAHDARHVGAGQVVDHEGVSAAECPDGDRLDVVEVHRDRRDVAREPYAAAVRGRLQPLADVAAVERHLVDAVLALDDVVAVTGIPLERVVAGAQQAGVVALLAVDEVVAVAAEQEVDAVAAEQVVVAGAPVDGDADQRGQVAGRGVGVVAAVGVDVSFSEVPMSIENGAGLRRSNRTRVPLAVVVNCSAPLPPLTSTVSVPAPPSLRSVSSPGFQIMWSSPLWPNAWSSASPPVSVYKALLLS